jgi:hypothetical protein
MEAVMGLAFSDCASHDRLRSASYVADRLQREHLVDETGTAGRSNSSHLYGSDPAGDGYVPSRRKAISRELTFRPAAVSIVDGFLPD